MREEGKREAEGERNREREKQREGGWGRVNNRAHTLQTRSGWRFWRFQRTQGVHLCWQERLSPCDRHRNAHTPAPLASPSPLSSHWPAANPHSLHPHALYLPSPHQKLSLLSISRFLSLPVVTASRVSPSRVFPCLSAFFLCSAAFSLCLCEPLAQTGHITNFSRCLHGWDPFFSSILVQINMLL